jgi:hypothetical protein
MEGSRRTVRAKTEFGADETSQMRIADCGLWIDRQVQPNPQSTIRNPHSLDLLFTLVVSGAGEVELLVLGLREGTGDAE